MENKMFALYADKTSNAVHVMIETEALTAWEIYGLSRNKTYNDFCRDIANEGRHAELMASNRLVSILNDVAMQNIIADMEGEG